MTNILSLYHKFHFVWFFPVYRNYVMLVSRCQSLERREPDRRRRTRF